MTLLASYLIVLTAIYLQVAAHYRSNHRSGLKPIPVETNQAARARLRLEQRERTQRHSR